MISCIPLIPVSFHLGGKTFPAGAVGHGIGIGHLEATLLKVIAVIQLGSAHEEGALGIDHDVHSLRGDKDVARLGPVDEIHFVLEAGATASDHGDTQRAVGPSLFGEQRGESVGCGIRDTAELFIPDLPGEGGFRCLAHGVRLFRSGDAVKGR
jgi:hypothetical protein